MARAALKSLADWMMDPEQMRRLDELSAVTQRTSFVKAILGIGDSDGVVCTAIQRSCQRQGIECKIPRGKPALSINLKELSVDRRYGASVLLKALYNTDDAGLDAGADGTLLGGELLDRMLYVYRRYLGQSGLTAADAPVSFELFALVRQQYALAELEFVSCENCGSEYISGRYNSGIKCPICATHKHAARFKPQEPVRHISGGDLRRSA
jgi:hypothetical protein